MKTTDYAEFQRHMPRYFAQVAQTAEPLTVTDEDDAYPIVLMTLTEYESLQRALHRLSRLAAAENVPPKEPPPPSPDS